MSEQKQVRIVSFDPLQLELPDGDTVEAGEVKLVLPPVRTYIARNLPPLPAATRFTINQDLSCSLLLSEALPVAQLAAFVTTHLDAFRTAHANLTATRLLHHERDFVQAAADNLLTVAMNLSLGTAK